MKFMIIALLAIVLVANAKMVYLSEPARSDEPHSSDVSEGASVPGVIQNIPLTQRACSNEYCDYICWVLGYTHGTCVSATTCQCYN